MAQKEEQPIIVIRYDPASIMPDGSVGEFTIGEWAGDRTKDLSLTVAQAKTLAVQINERIARIEAGK